MWKQHKIKKPSSINWKAQFPLGVPGAQTVILPALITWSKGLWILHGRGKSLCMFCAVGADTSMNNPWTTSQSKSVSVRWQNTTKFKHTGAFISQQCWNLLSAIWNPQSQIYRSKKQESQKTLCNKNTALFNFNIYIISKENMLCYIGHLLNWQALQEMAYSCISVVNYAST